MVMTRLQRRFLASLAGAWVTQLDGGAASRATPVVQPGTFLYHCTDYPWAIGEITVVP